METINVLFIGEIVGKSGVYCIKQLLPEIKREFEIDFVIANADGATGGFGIGKNHSIYLHKLGINAITTGECVYYKLDIVDHIARAPYILRAANYPYGNPGRGWMVYKVNDDCKIGVISLLGQSGYDRIHLSNPFHKIQQVYEKIREETPLIVLDFHATTTSEKYSMFHLMSGKLSAIVGTHAKALTADACIMNNTAVICDAGRTGDRFSVGGLDPEVEIRKFLTQIPEYSNIRCIDMELQGIVMTLNMKGEALSVQTIKRECKGKVNEGIRQDN